MIVLLLVGILVGSVLVALVVTWPLLSECLDERRSGPFVSDGMGYGTWRRAGDDRKATASH